MCANAKAIRPYSLRRRLTVAACATFVILLAILSIGLWTYARAAANRTYDLLLSGAAIAILERVTLTSEGVDIDLPSSALQILALAKRDRVFYRIFDEAGRTLTGTPDLPKIRGGELRNGPVFFDRRYSGESVRFVIHGRPLFGQAKPKWIWVEVGQTEEARDAMQTDLFLKGLIPLVALAVAGLGAVQMGIALAMRPLSRVEREISVREPSDLVPLQARPPREVESLIVAINNFMQRLGQSKRHTETFIADVAHQIRTSLAALQGHLELASEPNPHNATDLRVVRAREQAARTIRLTNQLLSHAMVIHRADDQVPEIVDLAELVRQLFEETVRSGASDCIEFVFDARMETHDEMRLRGDPIALKEALRNLIDNAIRHGPNNNVITVRITPTTLHGMSALKLSVLDRGPGIPDNDKERAVERFYSRGEKGGSGIGLAIVAAVAASHSGRFDLQDRETGGLEAALTLPVQLPNQEKSTQ